MNNLIEVKKVAVGSQSIDAVSARELYIGLGFEKSNWAKWYALNIEQNEFFKQGIDFIQLVLSTSSPNPAKDFAISIDFAKHISMMAKTSKGHEYRNYFIAIEKSTQVAATVVYNSMAIASELEGMVKIAGILGLFGNQALIHANRATFKNTGIDCIKLLEVELISDKKELTFNVTDIGKRMGGLSPRAVNQLLKDKGFQEQIEVGKNKEWSPTEKGKLFCEVSDTGVPHNTRMVKQIRWFQSIINELT
jgi:phage anti-repressor protein